MTSATYGRLLVGMFPRIGSSRRLQTSLTPKSISVGVMYPGPDTSGGVPLVRVADVKAGRVTRPEFCVSNEVDEEYKRTRLNGNELLVTLVGNPGDCVIVTEEMAGWNAARALAVLRLQDPNLRQWLRYVLLSEPAKHLIDSRLNTTVQKTLNLKDIKELPVPIAPQAERERISDIVSAFESKSLINRQTNQTLEQIAQAIFKNWFVDFEPVKAKQHIRALGGNDEQTERAAQAVIAGAVNLDVITTATDISSLDRQLAQALSEKLAHQTTAQREQLATTAGHFPDQLVESELGLVPEGWVVSAFSEVAANIRDSVAPTTIDSKIPYVGLEHIEKQQMHLANWGHAGDVDSTKLRFAQGDFLFGKLRPYFHKVCRPPIEGICSTDILVIRAVHEDWQGFVQCQLFDPVYVEYANVRSTGTRMPRASWRDMGSYVFVKPSIEIARVFTGLVGGFNQLAARNTWSCSSLIAIRDVLLPKLLSGELDLSGVRRNTAEVA